MALFTTATVFGTIIDIAEQPASGTVTFTPAFTVLFSPGADAMILPATITATLDVSGGLTVNLPATNDPLLNAKPWKWRVAIKTDRWSPPPFDIDAPAGALVDLFAAMGTA